VLKRLELLENKGRGAEVDWQGMRTVERTREELKRVGRRMKETGAGRARDGGAEGALLKLVLAAYPDRVCRRRASDRETAVMVGGGGVRLGRETVVQDAEYFVAVDARGDDRSREKEAQVRIASGIEEGWLEELFPQEVKRRRGAVFDEAKQRVVGVSGVYYRDLVLREERDVAVDGETAGRVLAEALKSRAREMFDGDERARNVLARVALLREHMPEKGWPAFDQEGLAEVLVEACRGRRSVEEVTGGRLVEALTGRLAWPLDRLLEEHAPEALEVPTGNRIKLQYEGGKGPVLAVRLQEVFGWTETPRVAGGRVPVVMHLLGPNYRPVQITGDLRSFWATTYFQVRKDLRASYPKHSWPEDPLTATPVAKGRKRG
jgi:ATP-dependent helicase HrpB